MVHPSPGFVHSEPCMDTYVEAHVYMLQTHAEHYQFEIALVTHRRRAPPDSHLLSSSISPSPSPTLFADFNNDIHPTQLGSDHSCNCLKPFSPWSMHMLEKICDDFELSAKGSNPCRQHAHMHSKVSKNGPLFCNQNRVTVWSVWQTCQHILTACCYLCLLCGFAHSLFSAGIRAMSVVLVQTQGPSCFQWRFVKSASFIPSRRVPPLISNSLALV